MRAILPNPKVIVADESVSMVDVSFQALILDNMLHLYARLLVESVPIPDPATGWSDKVALPPEDAVRLAAHTGCHFATPLLYEVGPDRGVACFLYQDRPVKADVGERRALPIVASA